MSYEQKRASTQSFNMHMPLYTELGISYRGVEGQEANSEGRVLAAAERQLSGHSCRGMVQAFWRD